MRRIIIKNGPVFLKEEKICYKMPVFLKEEKICYKMVYYNVVFRSEIALESWKN